MSCPHFSHRSWPWTQEQPSIAGFQCMALVCRCRMLAFTERSLKNVSFFQGRLCNDSFSNQSCDLAFLVDFCGASQILERKPKLSSQKKSPPKPPNPPEPDLAGTLVRTLWSFPQWKKFAHPYSMPCKGTAHGDVVWFVKGVVKKVIQFFGGARVLNTTWTRSFPNCPFVFFPAISFSCSFHFLSYNSKLKDSLCPKTCFQTKPQIKWARGHPPQLRAKKWLVKDSKGVVNKVVWLWGMSLYSFSNSDECTSQAISSTEVTTNKPMHNPCLHLKLLTKLIYTKSPLRILQ